MNRELEAKLVKKYPEIFKNIYGDPKQTCMCFGIECGDGWYDLLDRTCEALSKIEPVPVAEQIKEKYGGLRFYVGSATDEQFQIIDAAETESYEICERCGAPGRPRGKGWITTLCDECNSKR